MAERTMARDKVPTRVKEGGADVPATRETGYHLVPAVDIYETEEALSLVADVPGTEKDSLDIRVEEGILTIQGKVPLPEETEPSYQEFELLSYFRQFRLSDEVDRDKISADLQGGVLKVCLPRVEKAKPKQIQVKVS